MVFYGLVMALCIVFILHSDKVLFKSSLSAKAMFLIRHRVSVSHFHFVVFLVPRQDAL